MKLGVVDWICNVGMIAALALFALMTFQTIYEDFVSRYAVGKIIAKTVGPEGLVPGVNYTIEFTDPQSGKTYTQAWNPIMVGFGEVGAEVEVRYTTGNEEKFRPAYRGTVLRNSRNGFVIAAILLFVSVGIRLLRVS